MRSRSGRQRRGMPVLVAAMLLAGAIVCLVPLPAGATSLPARHAAAQPGRPAESVAYARIAVVRVLAYYNGTVASDFAPIPMPGACSADGALVGTTGTGLNNFDYLLVPTVAVNPIAPCQGGRAAFAQLYGTATSWSLSHIDVLLDVAYTGTGQRQAGAVRFSIDPVQIRTNGGASAPALLTLPLAPAPGSPAHDMPVLALPQPSDPPESGTPMILDLTGVNGVPLARDDVTSTEITTTLYPIALPASQLSALPQPAPTLPPTATPPQQTVVGGTAVPSAPPQPPTIAATTPTPLSQQVSLGAPEIDSHGRLIGMVVPDPQGNHVLASSADIARSIGAVTGKPGPLMTQWQQGLSAYYATPPSFDAAATTFTSLQSAYPDFGGVVPFQAAAESHSTDIPSLTTVAAPAVASVPGPSPQRSVPLAAVVSLAALVVLAVVLLVVLARRSRARRRVTGEEPASQGQSLPDLDLLPADLSPAELDARLELETTMPLPTIAHVAPGIERESTQPMPTAPALSRVRQGLALMPHAAGVTDPGVKRAADPNQDNILAAQGIRLTGGRVQPFGLFIVADGMGGHRHGQEASRLAIEIVSTRVLQGLRSNQPLPDSALKALLRDSVTEAGAELVRRNRDGRVDMGTTLTAALTIDDVAYVANIGDSRTYLMSPETGLRQLTEDHSVVASLVSHGVIRPEDVYTHPRRNQIYRSLGGDHEQVDVDIYEVPVQAGDKLLLCSDGLWEMVRDPQIELILRGAADPRQAADLLVREANANGGEDNISAVVVRLLDDVPQQAQPTVNVVAAPQTSEAIGDPMGQA